MTAVPRILDSVSHRSAVRALRAARESGIRPRSRRPWDTDMEEMQAERTAWRSLEGGGGMCHRVARAVECRHGWAMATGTYTLADGRVICGAGHCWNVLPDGSILDATADQWCEGHDIRTVAPDEPDYLRYRTAYDADFHPGMRIRGWPELMEATWSGEADHLEDRAAEASMGHGWWTEDVDAVRAKLETYVFQYAAHPRSRTEPCVDVELPGAAGDINRLALRMRHLVALLDGCQWERPDIRLCRDLQQVCELGRAAVSSLALERRGNRTEGLHPDTGPGWDVAAAAGKAHGRWTASLDRRMEASLQGPGMR